MPQLVGADPGGSGTVGDQLTLVIRTHGKPQPSLLGVLSHSSVENPGFLVV